MGNAGSLDIEFEINPGQACIMRSGRVGMIVRWAQQYRNVLDDENGLYVAEYDAPFVQPRDGPPNADEATAANSRR